MFRRNPQALQYIMSIDTSSGEFRRYTPTQAHKATFVSTSSAAPEVWAAYLAGELDICLDCIESLRWPGNLCGFHNEAKLPKSEPYQLSDGSLI